MVNGGRSGNIRDFWLQDNMGNEQHGQAKSNLAADIHLSSSKS